MNSILRLISLVAALGLASCGGGGGDPGTSAFGSGGSGSGTGGTGGGTSTAAYSIGVSVQRSGTATTQVSASETVRAVAVVNARDGSPVEGVVVTFAESGPGLLTIAPTSATALTDATGTAVVDLTGRAADVTGATTVSAAATVSGTAVAANKSIQVVSGSSGGTVAVLPAAINFVSSSPSGVAIVIKGAGGSGRSESAILTFKAVDALGAPVKDVMMSFTLNVNNGGAVIQPAQALTNANGVATTTVSSGSLPASIVVRATATGAGGAVISSQSDTLLVSNDVPMAGGFEIVAAKYNLDGRLTGDATSISAYVRDQNGNPVPDGVAISFTTDYGVVAQSTLGGCSTVNGRCSVNFAVQNPRGTGVATVIGQIRVGTQQTLADSVAINMAASVSSPFARLRGTTTPVTQLALTGTCKQTFELELEDGSGRSVAAGTVISTALSSTGATVSVPAGTPVLDSPSLTPTTFGLTLDLSSTDLSPRCLATGTAQNTGNFINLQFRTPGGNVFSQRLELRYPQ